MKSCFDVLQLGFWFSYTIIDKGNCAMAAAALTFFHVIQTHAVNPQPFWWWVIWKMHNNFAPTRHFHVMNWDEKVVNNPCLLHILWKTLKLETIRYPPPNNLAQWSVISVIFSDHCACRKINFKLNEAWKWNSRRAVNLFFLWCLNVMWPCSSLVLFQFCSAY